MEVNDEVNALKEMLLASTEILNSQGRIAVITFHSIEDRIVKNYFKQEGIETTTDNPFSHTTNNKQLMVITKKAIEATNEETTKNKRSRSAKLRVAEKI